MKKAWFIIVIAVASIAVIATIRPTSAVGDGPGGHPRWEYKFVHVHEIMNATEQLPSDNSFDPAAWEKALNTVYGSKGWELCEVQHAMWIFKRPATGE